ncbi:MAG: signal recognition particle subunit [Actinomycetota bacterium]|nr:signal recognition particle subunit [Actinomycetota bacterium]
MFDSLSDRLDGIFSKIRSRGRLTERDVDEVSREIRLALLEADVNVRVVKSFIGRVKERAVGAEVADALDPGQQFIKIVHEELVETLGGVTGKLTMSPKPPTVLMLAGLQGSGKTTAAAKLARLLKSQGLHPLLVGADLQRPAAVEQLRVLAGRVDVPFYSEATDPVSVARGAIAEAQRLGRNFVIVDTAGRLQIDTDLMNELRAISDAVQPQNTLLVVDAMTGQEAVNVAEAFNDAVGLDGVILTKIDGDARGGAALSVKEVVGKPILFAGTGEKLDEFEPFHPDRMASRILGMGDVLTLIEKVEATFEEEEKRKAEEIVQSGTLTLEDFLDQMQQIKRMGPLQNVLGMIPGMSKEIRNAEIDDREIARIEAIIRSMTPEERRKPDLINGSRRMRIAQGSGTSTSEINNLLKQFKQVQTMMKGMGGLARKANRKGKKGKGKVKGPKMPSGFPGGGLPGGFGGKGLPGGFPGLDPEAGLPGFPPR